MTGYVLQLKHIGLTKSAKDSINKGIGLSIGNPHDEAVRLKLKDYDRKVIVLFLFPIYD